MDEQNTDEQPNVTTKDDQSRYRLSADVQALIFKVIVKDAFADNAAAEQPVAILFGGQPGAGKAALGRYATEQLNDNAVKVDADLLRAYHPAYRTLLQEKNRDAADLTHPEAAAWAVKLTILAVKERRNLIIDGTMGNAESTARLCSELQRAGYKVQARVLAVDEKLSRLGIQARYEQQLEDKGHARWTNRDKHDQSYEGIPLTVERLESASLVDRLQIVNRAGVELYDNRRTAAGWQQYPQEGRAKLEQERSREWTQAERSSFEATIADVQAKMQQRHASVREMAPLAALRVDYEQAKPAAPSEQHTHKIRPR